MRTSGVVRLISRLSFPLVYSFSHEFRDRRWGVPEVNAWMKLHQRFARRPSHIHPSTQTQPTKTPSKTRRRQRRRRTTTRTGILKKIFASRTTLGCYQQSVSSSSSLPVPRISRRRCPKRSGSTHGRGSPGTLEILIKQILNKCT